MDISVLQIIGVPELADSILQFLPTSSILTLRLVCSAFHDACTQRRWFFKDMIKFADTEYLATMDQMTIAMAPWVRSVGFYRYKKLLAPYSSSTSTQFVPEESYTWLPHVITWSQLTIMEISVPWNDWTAQVENDVLELLETKARMALVFHSPGDAPQVVRTAVDKEKEREQIRVWECQSTLGLRELVLHSSRSMVLHSSRSTKDLSVGSLFVKLSRGVHPPSSPTPLCALLKDLVSFKLSGLRQANRVKVPWWALVRFLKTGAPALRELSLDAHSLTLGSALDNVPGQSTPSLTSQFAELGLNPETDEEDGVEEMGLKEEDEDEDQDKGRDMSNTLLTFPGIQTFTLLSDISIELVLKLGQAFPNLKSLTVSSLDPFWGVPAVDPLSPSTYGILPLSKGKSLAELNLRMLGPFPHLERLTVRQLPEEYRRGHPLAHNPDVESLTGGMLSPCLRELVLENTVAQGTRTLRSLDTPTSMRLERLGLIFKKCAEVSLGNVYRLDVCVEFLSRPCCQELRHLTLARGAKILGLMMGSIQGFSGTAYPYNNQWTTIRETIRARVSFVNHLRTLDLRSYPLLFPEQKDLVQKLNYFLRSCPHLEDLGLVDIKHDDVPTLFHGLGYCPEDYEHTSAEQDGKQQQQRHNPRERPLLYRLALDVLCPQSGARIENSIIERVERDLRVRFRLLEDLQVNNVHSLSLSLDQ